MTDRWIDYKLTVPPRYMLFSTEA